MRRCAGLGLFVFLAMVVARPAAAFEFFEGALQIHGFGESIVRVLNSDFDSEYDLSQMQFVLNIEATYVVPFQSYGHLRYLTFGLGVRYHF